MFSTLLRTGVVTPVLLIICFGAASAQSSMPDGSLTADAVGESTAFGAEILVEVANSQTFVLAAPGGSGVVVAIDGNVVLDLTTSDVSEDVPVKALTSLPEGRHRISVSLGNLTASDMDQITISTVGGMPLGIAQAAAVFNSAGPSVSAAPSPVDTMTLVAPIPSLSVTPMGFATGKKQEEATQPLAAQPVVSLPDEEVEEEEDNNGATSSTATVSPSGGGSGFLSRSGIAQLLGMGLGEPAPADGVAASSPLSPPAGAALTQAIQLTSIRTNGVVAATGQTLFGGVMDPQTYDQINVSIASSGRTTTVDVGSTTGQFAVRLFPEDLTTNNVAITLTGASSSDGTLLSGPVFYDFDVAPLEDGVGQALSRITFGATPDLYARVRAIGYEAYVKEQLDPEGISNAAFNAMNVDDLFEDTYTNRYWMFRSLEKHNLAHAAYSDRQLQEIMSEFWYNHFHASTKSSNVYHQTIEDRAFFRENAFGRFEDLLLYSARSPLMSQFLDNDLSVAGALNENYGREVLELHTVGLNAGYDDDDVIAVSRIFTGWNYRLINPGYPSGKWPLYEFEFRTADHDFEDKPLGFLDVTINGRSGDAGVEEGEELIAILASHAETQKHICGKLVQKFVADAPPANFVDLCVDAWRQSDGNTREILRAILLAPEFIETPEIQRNKVKTPFEYGASIPRIIEAYPDPEPGSFYSYALTGMEDAGYKPVYFPVPTGLPEVGAAWVNSGSLIARYRGANAYVQFDDYNVDTHARIIDLGLETAEEIAAFFLTVSTGDRFQRNEFEAIVDALKWNDGVFEPLVQDESRAYSRALGLLVALPSVQLQ